MRVEVFVLLEVSSLCSVPSFPLRKMFDIGKSVRSGILGWGSFML